MSDQDLPVEPLVPNGEAPEAQKIFIDETEWLAKETELAELRGYKKGVEESETRLGQPHPELQPPPTPPAPPPEFPTHSDEELRQVIEGGDLTKYHQMTTHNQKQELAKQRWEIQTQEIEPLRVAGTQTISELSGKFATQTMEHLDVPEVKKTYEERLGALRSQGQVVNSELHQGVYEWAVGSNIGKVQEKLQQGLLRAQEVEVNTPTVKTGRAGATEIVETPAVTEFFEAAAITRLSQKYPGLSPAQAADKEYARHGGWDSYYKKFYGKKEEEK